MYNRTIMQSLIDHLRVTKKITMLLGARQIGKTTLMHACRKQLEQEGRVSVFFSMEQPLLREQINQNPEHILSLLPITNERILVCIDEIQLLRNPTNFLKLMVDLWSEKIQLFVTGSSCFYIDHRFIDSLAGRKKIFTLFPLSFREFLHFKQKDDFIQYLRLPLAVHVSSEIMQLRYEYLLYGGYPELVLLDTEQEKKSYLQDIVGTYIYKDIYEAGIKMPTKYLDIMKLLAAQTGKLVNVSEIGMHTNLSTTAVNAYTYTMQSSFHLAMIRPFSKNIRKEISKMPKVYFYDHGIRNYLLQNFTPVPNRLDKGEIIENTFFQSFARILPHDQIQFRQSNTQQEVDFILEGSRAVEIKVDKSRFKPEKYKTFTTLYPTLPLECLDENDIIVA